jgi:transaldolase
VTSIFEKAFVGSTDYDQALAEPRTASSMDAKSNFGTLSDTDLRAAADALHPVYQETDTADGYVSMEVAPGLAPDIAGTAAEAERLWASVERPNLMIKVPGTACELNHLVHQTLPGMRSHVGGHAEKV